jgi:uncharacterized membrane protein (DUF4010 family)
MAGAVELLETPEARLAVALGIGLLIGAERERRLEQRGAGFAGVRTFTLAALLGGVLAYLESIPLMVAGAVVVAAFALTTYAVNRGEEDRGITTELALVVTYALGLLAIDAPVVAPGIAVVVTWILALRGELHQLVRKTLTDRELRDLLIFLLIALVVFPIAPDRQLGPYGAVNPQSLVRLVLVLMSVTSAGYLAQRLLNPRLGLAAAGFAAGFVSSSATIAAMGLRAREQPAQWRAAVAAGLGSSVATVVQYMIVVAAIDAGLLAAIAPSMGLAALVALLGTAGYAWLSMREGAVASEIGRPFRLSLAVGFAAVFVVVTIASSALAEWIGSAGIVLMSGVAAFVDAHSTAGSVASLHRTQSIDTTTAQLAILTALTTNSVTKIGLAWSSRHPRYGLHLTAGVLAIAAAAWAGLLIA